MAWKPNSPERIEAFDALFTGRKDVERKFHFGCPGYFVDGKMAVVLQADHAVVRVSDADEAALRKLGAEPWMPMPGRGMKNTVVVPDAVSRDAKALKPWIEKSLAYVATLKPKPKKG